MLTKTSEAFGRTNIEALSKGTPVIGSTNGAVPELINHQDIGYCSDDIDNIAVAITNYNFNPRACFEYAYDNYHIKKEITQLISLSKRLIM
jgi:glycosyltransferase involved in cell wall biosynthesis